MHKMGRLSDELIGADWWDGRSILDRLYTKVRAGPLWLGGIVCGFGIFSVLMDTDHLLPGLARQTHIPVTIVLGMVLIGAVAYNLRLFDKLVLTKEDKTCVCIKFLERKVKQ